MLLGAEGAGRDQHGLGTIVVVHGPRVVVIGGIPVERRPHVGSIHAGGERQDGANGSYGGR